jgi:putative DNA primase/helicase
MKTDTAIRAIARIPEEDIVLALETIKQPFDCFQFCEKGYITAGGSYANFLAMLLTPAVMQIINGRSPLFLITGPSPSGKTLLAEAVIGAAFGKGAAFEKCTDPGKEFSVPFCNGPKAEQKRLDLITTVMRGSSPVLWIEDLDRPLDSPVYANLATYGGRIWYNGVPRRDLFVVMSGFPCMSPELQRRTIDIELAGEPRSNTTMRPIDVVEEDRAQISAAISTLVWAWVSRGMPRHEGPVIPSFEAWSQVIGGILKVAGFSNFLVTHGYARAA